MMQQEVGAYHGLIQRHTGVPLTPISTISCTPMASWH